MRSCEVCAGLGRVGTPPRKGTKTRSRRVLIGERIVVLCDAHAAELSAKSVVEVPALRETFMEPGGRRSVVDRRSPLDRRIFPPRPEGRRCDDGRRSDDPRD